ncbi:MAG: gliding motility-associated C-terminal domain-containing protein, partial [Flavobacteriales bacterium]|nr:gliding motility-associated C-terminal domain-containing protein [Flavobacteriales bacterium]
ACWCPRSSPSQLHPGRQQPERESPAGVGRHGVGRPSLRGLRSSWGQLVYHTNDMEQGWDGRHQNGGGRHSPTGVYTWRLIGRARLCCG